MGSITGRHGRGKGVGKGRVEEERGNEREKRAGNEENGGN